MLHFVRVISFWLLVWLIASISSGGAVTAGETGHVPKLMVMAIHVLSGIILGIGGGVGFWLLNLVLKPERQHWMYRFILSLLIGSFSGGIGGIISKLVLYIHWAPWVGLAGGALIGIVWPVWIARPEST